MKLFFLIIFSFTILLGCGKKADPEFQGKINQEIIVST
jgi:hypothetical protein